MCATAVDISGYMLRWTTVIEASLIVMALFGVVAMLAGALIVIDTILGWFEADDED